MSTSSKVFVEEVRRKIMFEDGHTLNLNYVSAYDASGTYLRLWSDEGFSLINKDKILYHTITSLEQEDEQ